MEASDKMTSARPPAEGERSAISGYHAQYRISASLILRALREDRLQWIRVADPKAERVDDIQIGSPSRVDAFQVKWSLYGGNFTFSNLIKPKDNKPSLIAQLADGWTRLQKTHPGNRIVVHLITNEQPSVSGKTVTFSGPPPTPRHFSAFVGQVWNPAHKALPDSEWNIPEEWQSTWDELREASGLSDEEFESFVRDCELEFKYRLPVPEMIATRDQEIVQQDVGHLAQTLFETVADPERIIELNRDQLHTRLGWKERFEFKSRHELQDPKFYYSPVEDTVHQLEDALSNLPGGYIAVLGTPGSGKSTLLTQTLRHRPERLIRYYAYVPDARDPITLRGESINFLHDVVLAIKQAGFSVGKSPSRFDRDQLLKRFHEQLQLLHQDYLTTGCKTMILIDGLDHIAREQHPDRSLLQDLPSPEQVPDGVYFVIGSQTDELEELPHRVQHSIRQPDRRIEMETLSRKAAIQITEDAGIATELTNEQKEEIYIRSGGHPLSLVYLLNRLRNVTDTAAIDTVLQKTERFEGDITAQYYSYWKTIETDDDLTDLIGLLARMRGVIDLLWANRWADPNVVKRLKRELSHYFRIEKIENHERWYFFHNSFRLFLLEKTAESRPGSFDQALDRKFYRKLAEKCAESPEASYWAWEELYYRLSAEEHETVLKLASQERFRSQFLAFRPMGAILTDIGLAMRSAAACEDPIAFTRLVLAGAEINERGFYIESASIVPLLLDLDKKQIAIEHVRDGNRLRIDATEALRASLKLKDAGMIEEAKRVFELAEPLDLLASHPSIEDDPHDKNIPLLEAWAESSVHFRELDKIIETIRKICRGTDRFKRMDAETATRSLQNQMLFHVGFSLLNEERWEDLATTGRSFDTKDAEDLKWWFWLNVHTWRDRINAGDQRRAQDILEDAIKKIGDWDIDSDMRVALADGIYRILKDDEQTRKWLQDVAQPELMTDAVSTDAGLNPFLQRFLFNRLLHALGDQQSPSEIVLDSEEPRHQGIVEFERAICVIAHIWAEAWLNQRLGISTIKEKVLPILRIFNWSFHETLRWTSWYVAEGARGEFYTLLVDAVARHGHEAIESLRVLFENEWDNHEISYFWPADVRRQVIMALVRAGVDRRWATERLRALENMMTEGSDVHSRVDECRKQAEAWITLDDNKSARRVFDRMLQGSFGVGFRKDYQLDTWIKWLGRINKVEPEQAVERIAWFARAIMTLEETTDDAAARYAANELLAVTFRWSPRRAISLFHWFTEQRIIRHEEAVRIILQESLKIPDTPTQLVLFSLVDFLLPVATETDDELVIMLITHAAASQGNENALETARYVLSKVHIYALPSTRPKWRRAITRALLKLGLDPNSVGLEAVDIQPDQKEDFSSSLLKVKDGSTTLTIDEVKMRVSSVSDLQELSDNESDDSYFNWEPVVTHLAENLDAEGIHTLTNLFQSKRNSAQIFAILSEKLCDLGDREGAWSLGEQALKASTAYGWDRWYDGGSRLTAFRALVHADPSRARPLVYETLVRDLSGEFRYHRGVALNLGDILPLLTDELPIQEIWSEIERYVHALFDNSSLPTDGPAEIDRQPIPDTAHRAIADLLLLYIDHPVNAVAQAAQRVCAKLLFRHNPTIQDAVHEFLEKTESHQEHILMVLDAVSFQEPDTVVPFCRKIASLHQSPNYAIRRAAKTIYKYIGCELPDFGHDLLPPPVVVVHSPSNSFLLPCYSPHKLPTIYQLSLPPPSIASLADRENIRAGEPLPDSDDPVDILRPFDLQIGFVAEEARLPKVNMCHRAVQIMQQLAPQETWSAQGEKRLRATLDPAGLRLPFRRPRSVLACRAMFHVLVELIDANVLGLSSLRRLDPVLRFYDPVMMLAEPKQRPSDISPISGLHQYESCNEEWLEQVDITGELVSFKTPDGNIVLAEKTTLKHLDWERPTEIRRSVVCPSATTNPNSDYGYDSFFQTVPNRLVMEYLNIEVNAIPTPLILHHIAYGYDSHGADWLALNPNVGYLMRWKLANDGLFRWVDNEEQVMVESVWWVDGLFEQSPPHLNEEVGEGWLVVASPTAWAAINLQFDSLKRIVDVERSFYRDGQELKHGMQSEEVFL